MPSDLAACRAGVDHGRHRGSTGKQRCSGEILRMSAVGRRHCRVSVCLGSDLEILTVSRRCRIAKVDIEMPLQQGLNKARELDQWPRADHMGSTVSRAGVRMAGAIVVSQICTDAPKGETCRQNRTNRRCDSSREGSCRAPRDLCASSQNHGLGGVCCLFWARAGRGSGPR